MKSFTGTVSGAVWGSFVALIGAFTLVNILGAMLEAMTHDAAQGPGLLFMLISFLASPMAAVWGGVQGARIGRRSELLDISLNMVHEETQLRKAIILLAHGAIIMAVILVVAGVMLTSCQWLWG